MLRRIAVRPHEQLAPVGERAQRVPGLLPVDHEGVAVEDGRRRQRRQVGSGVGLREALAPDVVAAQHAGEQVALLLLGAVLHDRRRDVRQADDVHGPRRSGAVHLLGIDDLLHERCAPPAVLRRPGDGCVAGAGERAVPFLQSLDPFRVVPDGMPRQLAEIVGEVPVQPGPELLPERLGFLGIRKVHAGVILSGGP